MLYFDNVITVVYLQLCASQPSAIQLAYKDSILVVTIDLIFLNYCVFVSDLFAILLLSSLVHLALFYTLLLQVL